jgi:hypothetical protein
MVLGWPKICKLAYAFLWECSYQRLELAQLLGQLGVFLTRHRKTAQDRTNIIARQVEASTLPATKQNTGPSRPWSVSGLSVVCRVVCQWSVSGLSLFY